MQFKLILFNQLYDFDNFMIHNFDRIYLLTDIGIIVDLTLKRSNQLFKFDCLR